MTAARVHAQRTVDATYRVYGMPATYTPPGGSSLLCTIIIDLRDAGARPDDGRPLAGQIGIEVRTAEVASPARRAVFVPGEIVNGSFVPGAKTYTVVNRPMLDDEEGLVWKMWAE